MSKKLIALITTVVVMLAVASPATAQRINVKRTHCIGLPCLPTLGLSSELTAT